MLGRCKARSHSGYLITLIPRSYRCHHGCWIRNQCCIDYWWAVQMHRGGSPLAMFAWYLAHLTAEVTAILFQITPEVQVGGPIALIKDQDSIHIDTKTRNIQWLVDDTEQVAHRKEWERSAVSGTIFMSVCFPNRLRVPMHRRRCSRTTKSTYHMQMWTTEMQSRSEQHCSCPRFEETCMCIRSVAPMGSIDPNLMAMTLTQLIPEVLNIISTPSQRVCRSCKICWSVLSPMHLTLTSVPTETCCERTLQ